MKKTALVLAFITAMAALTACGKDKTTEPTEPESEIKVRNEVVEVSTELATSEQETTEPDEEQPVDYAEGKELATLHFGDKAFTIKSGDSLSETMAATNLKYLDWVMSATDIEAFSFASKGYGITDLSTDKTVKNDFTPSYVYFEITDENKVVADEYVASAAEDNPNAYKIAAVMTDLDDVNEDEFYVTYTEKNIKVGMTKADIEKLLGTSDKNIGSGDVFENAIYHNLSEGVVVFIDYNSADVAEKIYAMPDAFCPISDVIID